MSDAAPRNNDSISRRGLNQGNLRWVPGPPAQPDEGGSRNGNNLHSQEHKRYYHDEELPQRDYQQNTHGLNIARGQPDPMPNQFMAATPSYVNQNEYPQSSQNNNKGNTNGQPFRPKNSFMDSRQILGDFGRIAASPLGNQLKNVAVDEIKSNLTKGVRLNNP